MTPDEQRELEAFRRDHPADDDLPDEWVFKSRAFAQWRFAQARDELGRVILDELHKVPVVGTLLKKSGL